jgi:hypothetical protein
MFSKYRLQFILGPVQSRNTFLSPEAMNQYDELINQADMAVIDDTIVAENRKILH